MTDFAWPFNYIWDVYCICENHSQFFPKRSPALTKHDFPKYFPQTVARKVNEYLVRTTPTYTTYIQMRYKDGLTYEQIASKLNVDPATIQKVITSHARTHGFATLASIGYNFTEIGATDLEGLGLSARSYNALRDADIKTIHKLRSISMETLKEIPGLGNQSVREVRQAVNLYNAGMIPVGCLRLGQEIQDLLNDNDIFMISDLTSLAPRALLEFKLRAGDLYEAIQLRLDGLGKSFENKDSLTPLTPVSVAFGEENLDLPLYQYALKKKILTTVDFADAFTWKDVSTFKGMNQSTSFLVARNIYRAEGRFLKGCPYTAQELRNSDALKKKKNNRKWMQTLDDTTLAAVLCTLKWKPGDEEACLDWLRRLHIDPLAPGR